MNIILTEQINTNRTNYAKTIVFFQLKATFFSNKISVKNQKKTLKDFSPSHILRPVHKTKKTTTKLSSVGSQFPPQFLPNEKIESIHYLKTSHKFSYLMTTLMRK
jgi:hypothetical protein